MAEMRNPALGLRVFGWHRKAVAAYRAELAAREQRRTEAWEGAVAALQSDLAACEQEVQLRAAALAQAQMDTARLRQWVELSRGSLGWLRRGAEAEVRRVRIDHDRRLEQWDHQKAEVGQISSAAAHVLRTMLDAVAAVLQHLPPWLSEGSALGPRVIHRYVGDVDGPLRTQLVGEDLLRLTMDRSEVLVTDQAGDRGWVEALLLARESLALRAIEVAARGGLRVTVPVAKLTGVHAEGITVDDHFCAEWNDGILPGSCGDAVAGERRGGLRSPDVQAKGPFATVSAGGSLTTPSDREGVLSAKGAADRGGERSTLRARETDNGHPEEVPSHAVAPEGILPTGDAEPLPGMEGAGKATVRDTPPREVIPAEAVVQREGSSGSGSVAARPVVDAATPPAENAGPLPGMEGAGKVTVRDTPPREVIPAGAVVQREGASGSGSAAARPAAEAATPLAENTEPLPGMEGAGKATGGGAVRQGEALYTQDRAARAREAAEPSSETLLGDDVLHYLVGKLVGQELHDAQGGVIARVGDVIDVAVVHAAEVAGVLPELIVHMTLPGVRG